MGKLVDGQWITGSIISSDKNGAYDRIPRSFRDTIDSDSEFPPAADRYHLYVSYACPWATRALIYRSLKGLENIIDISVVHPDLLDNGWTFSEDFSGSTGDKLYQNQYLYQLYQKAQPDISTSVTVPILWDKKTHTIVNNESSEIIRIFNHGFDSLTGNTKDYYPASYRDEIDEWNAYIYEHINNGVYRCGFAKTQEAYDEAIAKLFQALDKCENRLKETPYLVSNELTEADIRLIPTLLRFDIVYYVHFKTNLKRLLDYPHLSSYVKRLMTVPAIRDNHNFDHIKRHYYYSHTEINPFRIIPAGPERYLP
ncbi:MAG: glutathione-dependent reductase [Legionellales bacterium]|nr:glutathione-dependent reductase [Legionellales bacterium]